MKVIKEWFDEYYLSRNRIFEFDNGFRLLHVKKEGIKDFIAELVMIGGSVFDHYYELPSGSAHFLEHVIALNPNKRFSTLEEMEAFRFGELNKPEIFINAKTWKKYMSFYTFTHESGSLRALDYLRYMLDFPRENIQRFIEKERGIILSEIQRDNNEKEMERSRKYDEYITQSKLPEFIPKVIGDEKSVGLICSEDLEKLFDNIFNSNESVLCIQSNRELNEKEIKTIKDISDIFKIKEKKKLNFESLENYLDVKHHKDEDEKGSFISMNFYEKYKNDGSHIRSVNKWILGSFLSHIGFKYLREKLSLVYGVDPFSSMINWDTINFGIKFSFENQNSRQLYDEFYFLIKKYAFSFLNSPDGEKWLNSQVSKYIYTRTVDYDSDYGVETGMDILCNFQETSWSDKVNYAKTLTTKKMIKIFEELFLNSKPHFWMVNNRDESDVLEELKASKLYEHFLN